MIPFCPLGDDYSRTWTQNGFSRCQAELLGSLVPTGVVVILGLSVMVLGGKPRSKVASGATWRPLAHSKVLSAEVTLCAIAAASYPIHFALHALLKGGNVYGYRIVTDSTSLLGWTLCSLMIIRERYNVVYAFHHSLHVVLFWLLSSLYLCVGVASWNSNYFWWWRLATPEDITDLVIFSIRSLILIVLVILGVVRPIVSRRRLYRLLINLEGAQTTPPINSQSSVDPNKDGSFSRASSQGSTFGSLWRKTKIMFPYIWPKRHPLLQLQIIMCFLILVSGRVINVYVPIYYKKIVTALTPHSNATDSLDVAYGITSRDLDVTFPIVSIIVYVGLRFLQGGSVGSMGLLNNLRSFLWISVQQYTMRAMQVDLFNHLHHLSLRWHLGRKTGEVLRVMDRGTNSINNLLSYILFNIVPTFVDIGVAVIYFVVAFDIWFGLIVFTTMVLYLLFTIQITEWRTKFRRAMNEKDNITKAKAVDSLLNFETVKYYGQEEYEGRRFTTAIVNYQKAEWKSLVSLNVLNSGQNIIITMGLLVGSLLCGYRVTQGILNVGDFVLFGTYIIQLYSPLNFFGTYYRLIQQAFIDMENVFDLLDVEQEVKDDPGALPLQVSNGRIEFRNVYFHYVPEKPILKNISFIVEPGETIALVGPSGAGKSTIIRLLFRFYDIQDGDIIIDGQDIRHIKQSSLRQNIGVVPQDTVLFNDIIRYNIRYGRVDASDAEVERAAEYADIHQNIQSFPLRYDTIVGERGLKLSGGEKQRVAIARTILKNPAIIMLDEATSALDTQTERNIQSSLMKVCQGRSTVIVAHRLSTIIHAHKILVLREGEVCERGTHQELLDMGGVYADMWQQQQRSLEDQSKGGHIGLEEDVGEETKL